MSRRIDLSIETQAFLRYLLQAFVINQAA